MRHHEDPLPADGLDDSWRQRHQRERKQSRKRRRRLRSLEDLLGSNFAEKIQNYGIAVIGAILVVTILGIYLNHRSGGRLFEKVFGI